MSLAPRRPPSSSLSFTAPIQAPATTPQVGEVGKPWDLLAVPREVPVYSLVTLGQALTLHYLLGEMRGLKVGIKLIWLTRGSVMSVLFSEFIRKQ